MKDVAASLRGTADGLPLAELAHALNALEEAHMLTGHAAEGSGQPEFYEALALYQHAIQGIGDSQQMLTALKNSINGIAGRFAQGGGTAGPTPRAPGGDKPVQQATKRPAAAQRGPAGSTVAGGGAGKLPDDALPRRPRDIPRIRKAEEVRQAIRPALQQAADEAKREFLARPEDPGRRYTGQRAKSVRDAENLADAVTQHRREEAARVQAGHGSRAELNRLRAEESAAWKRYNIVQKREAGNEMDAIFKRMINEHQADILGKYAGAYRLRTSASFTLNGPGTGENKRVPDLVLEGIMPDGKHYYTAHVYDLKTGEKGIEKKWELAVQRNARGLFTSEEIRPS